MLTTKQILTFNKEKNGNWYVESKAWEDAQTKRFRQIFTYLDKDGKIKNYEKEQDMSNPLDDHTKHPDWRDPHEDLLMHESFGAMLDKVAGNSRQLKIEVVAYGWVSNCFSHFQRQEIGFEGARYKTRFRQDLPQEFLLSPITLFLFGTYPEHFHARLLN